MRLALRGDAARDRPQGQMATWPHPHRHSFVLRAAGRDTQEAATHKRAGWATSGFRLQIENGWQQQKPR